MATFKAVVHAHQKRRDGTYNVKIRVTHNRRTRYLPTTVTVDASQLTRGLKIKDQQVVDALARTTKEMRDAVTALGYPAVEMDVDALVAAMRRKMDEGARFSLDFYEYGMSYARDLKTGTRRSYFSAFSNVLKYTGGIRPDVNDVTTRWLRGYIEHLQRAGISPDTVELYVSKLSKVHGLARAEFNDEDGGIIRIPGNPFAVVKAPSVPHPPKHRNINAEKVQAVIDLPVEDRINSRRNTARLAFLLSFGTQGMNLADLYDAREAPAGFITFTRKKTEGRRPVEIVVRIEPEIRALFAPFEGGGYIIGKLRERFGSYDSLYRAVQVGMVAVADAIGADVSFYSARHSWATIARNECRVDKWTVHEALSHADGSTSIDDVYLAPDYSRAWEANRAVLDLFRWN